jgi:DNA-binding transcriptional LysR family regulator
VHVEGQLTFNNLALRIDAALVGCGLAYLPEDQVRAHIAQGGLSECSPTGVRHIPDITFIIRAGDTRRPVCTENSIRIDEVRESPNLGL